jgi:hypothetical protein
VEGAIPVEIEPKDFADSRIRRVPVAPGFDKIFRDVPFQRPFREGFTPKAKVYDGQAVIGFIVQYGHCAFTMIHLKVSLQGMDVFVFRIPRRYRSTIGNDCPEIGFILNKCG